jgi:hypothetical protein
MTMSLKSVIYGLAIFAFPIAPFVVFGGAFYILYAVNACITEVRREIHLPSGLKFSVVETDCSTLGEDASVSIYGLDEAHDAGKTLLFKFGPDSDQVSAIEITGEDGILISIPSVSDVIFMETMWMDRLIKYNIGHADYPKPDPAETR